MFVTAGLIAAALALGGPLVANAAPAPTITLSAATASPYGQFNVSLGTGFGTNAPLTFELDGSDVTNQLVSPVTDASGSFTGSSGWLHFTTVGGGSLGTHTLVVTDNVAHLSASANITVVPDPVAAPTTARLTVSQITHSGVKVRFSGFTPGGSVSVGMYNRGSGFGGECATVVADAGGVVNATCIWDAAYVTRFGSTPGPGVYGVGANSTTFNLYSTEVTVTVADPTAAAPAIPTPALPATPVRNTANFTG